MSSNSLFYFKDFIYLFLDRWEGRKKEMERNINMWLPLTCLSTRDLALNPGVCPDWESNRQPFGSQARTQSTEPHQPGLSSNSLDNIFYRAEDFNFNKYQLINYLFYRLFLWCKKTLPYLRYSPLLLSRSFIVCTSWLDL